MKISTAVGMDLGSTTSSVAYLIPPMHIVSNDSGSRFTPSVVYFGEGYIKSGEKVEIAAVKAENVIFNFKELIGVFKQDAVIEKIENFLGNNFYKIGNKAGRLAISVEFQHETLSVTPETLCGLILHKLGEMCSGELDEDISDVVMTVPYSFNSIQRSYFVRAAGLAGLNVLRLVNESTAAAIAYSHELISNEDDSRQQHNILVFNLGGNYFETSIIQVDNNNRFRVLACRGHSNLGSGRDKFDMTLWKYYAKRILKIYSKDISKDKQVANDLWQQVTRARVILTKYTKTTMQLDGILADRKVDLVVTRAIFEQLCESFFQAIMDRVKQVLGQAKMEPNAIDYLVMSGGCSRTPRIQQLLKETFPTQYELPKINPEEAAVQGAAILARSLQEGPGQDPKESIPRIELLEITSGDYYLEAPDGKIIWELPQGTQVPYEKTFESSLPVGTDQRSKLFFRNKEKGPTRTTTMFTFSISPEGADKRGRSQAAEGLAKVYLIIISIDGSGILKIVAKNTVSSGKKHQPLVYNYDFLKHFDQKPSTQYGELIKFVV